MSHRETGANSRRRRTPGWSRSPGLSRRWERCHHQSCLAENRRPNQPRFHSVTSLVVNRDWILAPENRLKCVTSRRLGYQTGAIRHPSLMLRPGPSPSRWAKRLPKTTFHFLGRP